MVGAVGAEGRGADDDAMGALFHQLFGAFRGADAAADAAAGLGAKRFDDGVVFALTEGGIEVDDLDLREARELLEHDFRRVAFEGLLFSLDELDDLAVHEVNTG